HAQALAALDRPGPTLVGRGLWAAVAASARGGTVDARQLRTDGPPPVGDPMRADWIRLAGTPRLQTTTTRATVRVEGEAVATLDLTRGGLARVAATGAVDVDAPGAVVLRSSLPPIGDVPLSGLRVPRHPSGRPWSQAVPRDREAQSLVGCNPCVVAVGEAVRLPGHVRLPVGWSSPGVRAEGRGSATVLHTSAPASVQLRGIEASDGSWSEPLRIEVRAEAESPLHPLVRLEMAEVATARGQVPDLSDLTDVPEGRLALVGLTSALQAEDEAAIVEHFMRLVAVQPSTPLSLGDVATVARAMATQGRHEGAARVWRAGLDAAFNAEAAGLNQLEGAVGTLATSKLIRDTAQRYPDGNAVGEALYLLPTELRSMAGSQLDETVVAAGITAMDLRLTAAAWDREFLALNRDHDRAPAAGLRLARSLLTLGAPERATNWARAIARAHPDDPLVDALTYLEALARTESEQPGAETLLKRLVDEPFPNQMGTLEPSTHRSEAQLVLGRLYEARGQVDRALQAYGVIAADVPEAARSVTALEARRIEIPALVRVMPGQPATLETELQGIDELQIRVYSVDLKSIFLRDQGLSEVRDMPVAGVSPTWAATRRVGVGPFPVQRTLTLPLSDRGAWLVHLEGDGVRASSLVVRSGLKLAVSDHTGVRRVTVQRDGRPAPGVEVRALARGRVDSATTDVRGVAEVGAGSPVFAFDEEHVAFTDPDADPSGSARPAPAAQALPLKQLDSRLGSEQAKDQETYRRRFKSQASEELMLNAL
ncbi:MAG: tetratricopeptide repeat protein, partial [Myxococcales bacterium]|nr:tetratricopeptide repeat protein [Myxococcales bacterium]